MTEVSRLTFLCALVNRFSTELGKNVCGEGGRAVAEHFHTEYSDVTA